MPSTPAGGETRAGPGLQCYPPRPGAKPVARGPSPPCAPRGPRRYAPGPGWGSGWGSGSGSASGSLWGSGSGSRWGPRRADGAASAARAPRETPGPLRGGGAGTRGGGGPPPATPRSGTGATAGFTPLTPPRRKGVGRDLEAGAGSGGDGAPRGARGPGAGDGDSAGGARGAEGEGPGDGTRREGRGALAHHPLAWGVQPSPEPRGPLVVGWPERWGEVPGCPSPARTSGPVPRGPGSHTPEGLPLLGLGGRSAAPGPTPGLGAENAPGHKPSQHGTGDWHGRQVGVSSGSQTSHGQGLSGTLGVAASIPVRSGTVPAGLGGRVPYD